MAELARMLLAPHFGETLYNQGINVYTTIRSEDQRVASAAVRKNLINYDRRYGYRGADKYVDLSDPSTQEGAIRRALASEVPSANLLPGVVTKMDSKSMTVVMANQQTVTIESKNFAEFAKKYIESKDAPLKGLFKKKELKVGAVVRITQNKKGEWLLGQVPVVESAFLAADFTTGAVHA